jgi:hypothetical protein
LHLHTCVHIIYTRFILLPPFPATYPLPLMPTPLAPDLFCPPLLQFCRRKKERHDVFLVWDKDSYTGSDVPMHICITTPISSYLLVFFTPP